MADIALISLGTTPGLRRADAALAELLREAGADCELREVRIGAAGALRRHVAVTDLVEARAAARAARGAAARATIFSTVTAALLARSAGPYAVRFDAPAALNRPGAAGAWQRRRERRVLAGARVLLPWGRAAAAAIPVEGPDVVVLPVPVEVPPPAAVRDLDALAYAGWPWKRGLDVLCDAWSRVAPRSGRRLVIGGCDRAKGRAWLERSGVAEPPGVEWLGPLPRAEWLALVGRARVFVNASRREDHGLAQLEALAAGTPLVTAPSPGPYEALPLARELAPGLVAADGSTAALAEALRAGLALGDGERAAYAGRATELLEPYGRDAVLATIRDELLPRLLG